MTTRRQFLAGASAAVAAGTLAGCVTQTTLIDGPAQEAAATQFRGGLRRQGYQNHSVPSAVERDWRHDGLNTGDHTAAKASPVRAPSGDIVVPGDNGEVWALTPGGERRWRASVEDTQRGIHGTPVIANETVYIGAYDGALYAFDLESGDRHWRTSLGDSIGSSPGYVDGEVYIAVEHTEPSGSLAAVDALDGSVTWIDDRPTDHPHSTLAIDRDTGTLVVGSNDGSLYAWEFPERSFAWSFETDGAIKGPVATADGAAFFGSWDHNVYRVDLETGKQDWAFAADLDVMTGPAVLEDVVYAGSHDHTLYAIERDSGDQRWALSTGGMLTGCPVATPAHVLVGSYDGFLYCVTRDGEDREGGQQVWRAPANGHVSSTPLVTETGIYVTDRATDEQSGAIYKFVATESA
jgi:outer membrane protein assembly factor BamB